MRYVLLFLQLFIQRMFYLLVIAALILVLMFSCALADDFTVVDGDTIKTADGQRLRIEGYDTPEIFQPECDAERMLGLVAKARLIELMPGADVIYTGRVGYWKRPIIKVFVNGADVGEILIGENLAVPWAGKQHDWCG